VTRKPRNCGVKGQHRKWTERPRLCAFYSQYFRQFPAGQSLYSLATSASPNPEAVFGNPATFGTANDPMIGKAIGGVIVFCGGLALYSRDGKIVGGLGLSGDTSCTDHIIAWKIRHELQLDAVPMGPAPSTMTV
jgi:hypothetical protein